MREIELHHLHFLDILVDVNTRIFRDPSHFVYLSSTIGNAHYTTFGDNHYAIEHLLSTGGRVVIDVKYEPDWINEDIT